MLDVTVAFASGQPDVRHAGVVLEIQELLRAALRLGVRGHAPERLQRIVVVVRRRRKRDVRRIETATRCRGRTLLETVAQAVAQRPAAVAGAGRRIGLRRFTRHETVPRRIPPVLPTGLRMQVHGRAPAARHGDQVAFDLDRTLDQVRRVAGPPGDPHTAHPSATKDIRYHVAGKHGYAPVRRAFRERSRTARAAVDDHHGTAGIDEVERRLVGRVVVREYDGAFAWTHGISIDIAGNRGSQHDARTVVVTKSERPFERALRKHHLLRAHSPQPLAHTRAVFFRQVIRAAFGDGEEVVIVVTENGAARQQRDVIERLEQRHRLHDPVRGSHSVDAAPGRQQRAAERTLFVGENHAGARLPGRERRRKSGGPATRD